VLQHPVLVDAGFVREGVGADDGLVWRHRDADDRRQRVTGRHERLRVDARTVRQRIGANFEAITISSSDALPARSPMPLMVHSTWRAPATTAASEFATANPRSLWQCADSTARSPMRLPTVVNIRSISVGSA
jgi:hypothetical protein